MPELGRILIADDDEAFRASTAELLTREAYACEHAADAAAAAQMIGTRAGGGFDLLIAGLDMPDNRQLELVRAAPGLSRGLPVIVVSANANVDSALEALRLHVGAYLVKPVDPRELMDQVRLAARQSLAHRGIVDARMRLDQWRRDIVAVESGFDAGQVPPTVSVDSFVSLTLGNIAQSLMDLQRLASNASSESSSSQMCQLMPCPRLSVVRRCLRGAVGTLEQTKGSFKSRELGELRRNLQQVLTAIEE